MADIVTDQKQFVLDRVEFFEGELDHLRFSSDLLDSVLDLGIEPNTGQQVVFLESSQLEEKFSLMVGLWFDIGRASLRSCLRPTLSTLQSTQGVLLRKTFSEVGHRE